LKRLHYSNCRWLLSLPDIDVNLTSLSNYSILHAAVTLNTPLDLVIALTRLASKETIELKLTDMSYANICHDSNGLTALDLAVKQNRTSTAQCKDENRKYDDVTLQTWLDAG